METPGVELFAAMQAARNAFLPLLEPNTPDFWTNLLDQQVIEAREHLEAGNHEKLAAEIADLFCVGYQALLDLGKDPEPFIVARIRNHIIPKAAHFAERDRAGNGYKPTHARDQREARWAFCPAGDEHAWNHRGRDWIECSLCGARIPSIEAVQLGRGPQLETSKSAFQPPAPDIYDEPEDRTLADNFD